MQDAHRDPTEELPRNTGDAVDDAVKSIRLEPEGGGPEAPRGIDREYQERQPHGEPGRRAMSPGSDGALLDDLVQGYEQHESDAEAIVALIAAAAERERHGQERQHRQDEHGDDALVQFGAHLFGCRSLRRVIELADEFG